MSYSGAGLKTVYILVVKLEEVIALELRFTSMRADKLRKPLPRKAKRRKRVQYAEENLGDAPCKVEALHRYNGDYVTS
ncbi:unnamed protein product [Phyllotreta striolata]|uniref:Uncharacterized protein n=1 Tax=Phyllotreta striolata TaxID=444603 RepID=A0A9N9XMR3_PHYSR|nr:unnamed protein product [Phyllotreta striolata]